MKGIPIVKGKDRYEAGILALNSLPEVSRPDLFILDDGFQHWGLFRDKDVLLIDSMNPFGNRKLLPMGPLREPISEINRAGIIIITKKESVLSSAKDSLIEEIREYNKKAPVFFSAHIPLQFMDITWGCLSSRMGRRKIIFRVLRHRESRVFPADIVIRRCDIDGTEDLQGPSSLQSKRFRGNH